MISADENRRLTESGPETPGGDLLRRYWQPAALTEELDGERPLVPVRLLGQDLVLYRDDTGRLGLLDRACSHRRADLAYGRLEDGGLRCTFHGWLYNADGDCLETPAEPAGSTFCTKVRHGSYPVIERNGIIWAWLGDGPPPELPGIDALAAPATQVFSFKGMWNCNWLQAHEVGIDPSHASFLHRFLDAPDDEYGLQFRSAVGESGLSTSQLLERSVNPKISLESTSYGFRLVALRDVAGEFSHVRVTNCLFPNAIVILMSEAMTITQWHVPIDDHSCYWYSMFVSYGDPVDAAHMRAQRVGAVELPSYRPKTNRQNHWGYDPEDQRTTTFTGMGPDINVHDQWAVESPGTIHDRTREHLSPSDVGIRTHRRMLLDAMSDVSAAASQHVTGPAAIDAIDTQGDHDGSWRSAEAERRAGTGWASPLTD